MLRVVSWNVRDLLGDPLAVHRVLRGLDPDLLCLQELPRRRPTALPRAALLARATGLRLLAGGRGTGGTAVLVRPGLTVVDVERLALPVGRGRRTRGAVLVEVDQGRRPAGGPAVSVVCVHLGLDPAERLAHALLVLAAVARRPGRPPLLVAGDLNAAAGTPPEAPEWDVWLPARDPWPAAPPTFPAAAPTVRIDAVLLAPELDAVEYGEGGADDADLRLASDHRPVLAVVRAVRR